MEEKRVEFNTALLARDKGFNIHCDWRYIEEDAKGFHDNDSLINWKDYRVKECIDYDRVYAYRGVKYLAESYFDIFDNKDLNYYCSAPSQSLLQKWLREEHRVDIQITRNKSMYHEYRVEIYKINDETNYQYLQINENNSNYCKWFNTYEDALEEGLFEALKLIE